MPDFGTALIILGGLAVVFFVIGFCASAGWYMAEDLFGS